LPRILGGQLDVCGHCASRLRPALFAPGWAISLMVAPAVTPLGLQRQRSHMDHLSRHSDTPASLPTST